jgi:hypothetical protein
LACFKVDIRKQAISQNHCSIVIVLKSEAPMKIGASSVLKGSIRVIYILPILFW